MIGKNPNKWRANIATYAGVVYQQLYDGIDLRFDGSGGQIKSTYTIAPGTDPYRLI
jgi:large repetitive protein